MNRRKFFKFVRDGLVMAAAVAVVGLPEEKELIADKPLHIETSEDEDYFSNFNREFAAAVAQEEDRRWMEMSHSWNEDHLKYIERLKEISKIN